MASQTSTLSAVAAATSTLSAAERSYPMSEVRGRSREDPMPEGQRPRGLTPRPRSGAVAKRSYPASEVRALVRRSYPTPPGLRPGAVAGRINPTSKEP